MYCQINSLLAYVLTVAKLLYHDTIFYLGQQIVSYCELLCDSYP